MNSSPATHSLSTGAMHPQSRFVRVYIQTMKKLVGRIQDYRHERYIERLALRCRLAALLDDRIEFRVFWPFFVAAIGQRSQEQIARMERRMGVQ